jgi:hypothetical protein
MSTDVRTCQYRDLEERKTRNRKNMKKMVGTGLIS